MVEVLGTWVAAFLTLCIFSFLYKENPFYRLAEHIFIGVSVGYGLPLTYHNVFIPYVYTPIFLRHELIYIFPCIIGIGFLFRFHSKLSWLSRYPIAFQMGVVGMGVPVAIHANTLVQMRFSMLPLHSAGSLNINLIIIFIGTITILSYFFFSKAHTGTYKSFTRIGVWYMMVGFGASFGYTVMARLSLLIGRIQFLIGDWLRLIQ